MNKLFLLFLFFVSFNCGAQDTLAIAKKQNKTKTVWSQKDIHVDTISRDQVSFPTAFKSRYKGEDFVYELKAHEKNAWDRFKEWLSDLFSRLFSFSNKQASMNFVEILLKILAVLIIIFVIYLIVKSIMNKEGQWIFGKNSDKKIINYDEIEKNLHLVDFEKLLKETMSSGEKRLSIRYYYLWLLKKMSDREIIEWDAEKTNSDYLNEIKDEKRRENFAYLSYLYNYIWYGEFEIDEAIFEKAKMAFEKTIQSI